MKCNQKDCENDADHKFTWPGRDAAGICCEHLPKLIAIANALGFYLQILPLLEGEHGGDEVSSRGNA
jgi:hypothetical protein